MKQEILDRIVDTNKCIDALEFKEQKAEWSKELKDSVNQVAEQWNEKFIVAKQEQGMERKAISEQVNENINNTQELEAWVIRLEITVVMPNKTTKEYSSEIDTLRKNQRGKVDRLKTELIRGATNLMVDPTLSDERTKFLLNWEWDIDLTGNVLTYKEKSSFISEQFQGYAVRWYTNGLYNVTTNKHFKNSLFEGCYGKIHTKNK